MIREYIGSGVLGRLAAQLDELERQQREEETACWRVERERLEELASLIDELCEDIEIITHAMLLVAGFRRHKRGEWRRKRDRETNTRK